MTISILPFFVLLTGLAFAVTEGDGLADRLRMVATQLEARGIHEPLVLAAMREVSRQEFVPQELRVRVYDDRPLAIGSGQTISQPYIVARMSAAIHPRKVMRVLEIGTDSGHQAAVLAHCVAEVQSVEVVSELGLRARETFERLGIRNVEVHIADGFDGWLKRVPYDAILLTAVPTAIPAPLRNRLRVGGRLVAPLGREEQEFVVLRQTPLGSTPRSLKTCASRP